MSAGTRSQLLQKLARTLVKNATNANEIDLVIFVAVDLINRIKNENALDLEDKVLYASMNEKAGKKALLIPDFSSAAKYADSGLSFLGESQWETHRKLMLSLHQTSVLALFSLVNSNQDLLKERIDAVLLYSTNMEEEFKTRLVWIKLIHNTSSEEAIIETHKLLERLGEPIESAVISPTFACSELARVKALFSGRNQLASQMVDPNKIMAMVAMSCLFYFYYKQRTLMLIIVCNHMVETSMKYGCSQDTIFALSSFASNYLAFLGDIDGGYLFARQTLSLMTKSHYNINAILPEVVS